MADDGAQFCYFERHVLSYFWIYIENFFGSRAGGLAAYFKFNSTGTNSLELELELELELGL